MGMSQDDRLGLGKFVALPVNTMQIVYIVVEAAWSNYCDNKPLYQKAHGLLPLMH